MPTFEKIMPTFEKKLDELLLDYSKLSRKELKEEIMKILKDLFQDPDASNSVSTKKNNEKNAKKLEKKIADDVNNNTEYGKKIKTIIKERTGKIIVSVEHIGGKKHYDLLFKCSDGKELRCELKSSKTTYHPSKWNTPWEHAGQFLNGSGDKWRIRKFYARKWYEDLPELKMKYQIESKVPTYDEWWTKDASMGSVQTEFGKEFKAKVSKEEKRNIKKRFVEGLHVPDEEVAHLLEDYLRESKIVLEEKDCWLVVSHDDIAFFDKIKPENITKIERNFKSDDLLFKVHSEKFKDIRVRWQNGICIANISVKCT